MLVPIWVASLLAAILVAAGSLELGRRWAMADVVERFRGIRETIRNSHFPLKSPVLDTIGGLTSTELIAFSSENRVLATTGLLDVETRASVFEQLALVQVNKSQVHEARIVADDHRFLAYGFERLPVTVMNDAVVSVVVLFEQDRIDDASQRAAGLPLATGMSTLAFLTAISTWGSRRLVDRMIRLKSRVQRVAKGDFDSRVADDSTDELGQLGSAVDSMAEQLDCLWKEVNRQQGEKLLHQIASGMAHQLRNTLTGSRMAMELHRRDCDSDQLEEISVAIEQLEIAEDYVQRLLKVGAGQTDLAEPAFVMECMTDLKSSHTAIAKHLRVELKFELDDDLGGVTVADGVALTSAIANLILNAMQAANDVLVQASKSGDQMVEVQVRDRGPGVDAAIAPKVFEPFVTSKPEGMGLGLTVVRRAANDLKGEASWHREAGETVFVFRFPITSTLTEATTQR